jgi:hypothetical protein
MAPSTPNTLESQRRWIDRISDDGQPQQEMQVLCLGLSRTATMCLYLFSLSHQRIKLTRDSNVDGPQNSRI